MLFLGVRDASVARLTFSLMRGLRTSYAMGGGTGE